MGLETEFKNWWRKRFVGLSFVHEPRASIGEGFPDVTILRPEGLLLPIEFKIGEWGALGHRLFCDFEPAQPAWHIKFQRAGGVSLICVGERIGKNKWNAYCVKPGMWLMEWEAGIPPEVTTPWTLWK